MKHKILLVDDQDEIRSLLSDSFRVRGYDVMEAADAAGLKAALAGPQPDVVLLDFKLPDADGLDLIPLIKREWPETESIVLTGHGTLDLAVEATKRGAFHFQTKPHNEGLYNLVERALERKQASQENCKLIDALKQISGDSSPIRIGSNTSGILCRCRAAARVEKPHPTCGRARARSRTCF